LAYISGLEGTGGTEGGVSCFDFMSEQLPHLVEHSLQIAWDFLNRTGQISDPHETAEFLLRNINSEVMRGERRTLMLSNRAINAYRAAPKLHLVS
jgi:hypothetical protein